MEQSKHIPLLLAVPMTAKTTLSASASAWSTFAYLKGQVLSKAGNLDKSKLVMEYKQANAETWTSVPAIRRSGERFLFGKDYRFDSGYPIPISFCV